MNRVKNSLYSIRGDGDSGKGNVLKRLYLWYENKVEGAEISHACFLHLVHSTRRYLKKKECFERRSKKEKKGAIPCTTMAVIY